MGRDVLGCFCIAFLFESFISLVHVGASREDVSALNVMYSSLGSPSALSGWKSSGGDPCGQSWKGITCSGSSVTEIDISGLGLSGSLGYQLANLKSVTRFDVSKNKLQNDIPYQLPPKLQFLDVSENSFTNNIPYSLSMMSNLKYLNLGKNKLSGDLTDMFKNLSKLTELDVSSNKMQGNLPQSMSSLSSLNKLYLQNNQFTGSINILARLPQITTLNVENNKFTGWIPNELKDIESLKTGGNSWSSGAAPPPPPGTKPFKRHRKEANDIGSSAVNILAKIGMIIGVIIATGFLVGIIVALMKRRRASSYYDDDRSSHQRATTPLTSLSLSAEYTDPNKGFKTDHNPSRELKSMKSMNSSSSLDIKTLQKCPSNGPRPSHSDRLQSFQDNEFARRLNEIRSSSFHAATYTLSDLQSATGNFATGRLLGEGAIGRVYRAKYPDGKVLAVKKIDSSLFQGMRPEQFSEVIATITKLKHPNVALLVGYCSEQGHNLLVYEYFRNGSIHEFLHLSDDFSKPLTWNTRVRIALGTARAIEYLHESSPPIVHKNIKSSNIFLDMELNPRLSDCGLATFYKSTSRTLGVGYSAPECTTPSAYTLKSDVYSFGVVMLELLSGRMPYESSRPRSEQCLVRWATPQLHDIDALESMADPALRGLYPPKSLSRFADIISLCVQEEPEFRPTMSDVVQSLVRLVQSSSMNE